jgi:hypothetical protein
MSKSKRIHPSNPSPLYGKIVDALQKVGPMTGGEMAKFLETYNTIVVARISTMRANGFPIYISGWGLAPEGRGGRKAPIYAYEVGKKDVPEPPAKSAKEQRKSWYARNRVRVALKRYGATSVLGRINNPFGLSPEQAQGV